MPTKFYTITEAAAILGLSRVRVWQLIKRDKLAAQRPGHEWTISHQALRRSAMRKRGNVGVSGPGGGTLSPARREARWTT